MLGSYLARSVTTLVGSLGRGRASLGDVLRFGFWIWPTDIDVYGHVNNGRCLTLMDFGRFDFIVRTGLYREIRRNGWRPLVAAAEVRFRRELKPFQRCELVTRLAHWDEKWVFFEQRIERNGEPHALGLVKGVLKRRGETVAPSAVAAAVGYAGPVPQPSAELARWLGGA